MYTTLLLGSNLGDSEAIISQAYEQIVTLCGTIVNSTAIGQSEPWGFESTHNFYNQILVIETSLSPLGLLDKIENIERALGRVKTTGNWQLSRKYTDRTIDIDILFYGPKTGATHSIEYEDDRLKIPHPHIQDRQFTLSLLAQLPNGSH